MTDSEYERLAAVAEGDGMTLGEWVREVLLERAEENDKAPAPSPDFGAIRANAPQRQIQFGLRVVF